VHRGPRVAGVGQAVRGNDGQGQIGEGCVEYVVDPEKLL